MKSSLFGPLILLLVSSSSSSVVFGLGSVVKNFYKPTPVVLSWKDAQSYCRREFTDLATIYTESDIESLYINEYYSWIGLHRDPTRSQGSNWIWSDGENYNVDYWQDNMTYATGNCAVVKYNEKRIYVQDCGARWFFICRQYYNHGHYKFIPVAKTWPEALQYCKSHYRDLVSFSSSYFSNVFTEQEFPIWIGLQRDGASWNWTWEESNYRNWQAGEPKNNGDCGSISSMTKKMASQNCDDLLPFICIEHNVVLVKENKSWEEALEHCRRLSSLSNTNVRYDFLSLQPQDELGFIMNKVMRAESVEVWLGLRFLAGDWLWVNGADMLHADLPLCPTRGRHCGVLSKTSAGSMEARDCSERKNFFCYSYIP